MRTLIFSIMLTSIMVILPLFALPQAISSVTIYPANPGPEDSVKVIASVWLPSGTCWLDNHYGVFSQDTLIDIVGTFDSGMLTVICNTVDTFELGRLEAGTYHCTYIMKYVGLPAFADTASQSFVVGPVSGLDAPGSSLDGFSVAYDPGTGLARIRYSLLAHEAPLRIMIYAADGRLVRELETGKSTAEDLVSFAGLHGIYLVSLETTASQRYTQKLLIQ